MSNRKPTSATCATCKKKHPGPCWFDGTEKPTTCVDCGNYHAGHCHNKKRTCTTCGKSHNGSCWHSQYTKKPSEEPTKKLIKKPSEEPAKKPSEEPTKKLIKTPTKKPSEEEDDAFFEEFEKNLLSIWNENDLRSTGHSVFQESEDENLSNDYDYEKLADVVMAALGARPHEVAKLGVMAALGIKLDEADDAV